MLCFLPPTSPVECFKPPRQAPDMNIQDIHFSQTLCPMRHTGLFSLEDSYPSYSPVSYHTSHTSPILKEASGKRCTLQVPYTALPCHCCFYKDKGTATSRSGIILLSSALKEEYEQHGIFPRQSSLFLPLVTGLSRAETGAWAYLAISSSATESDA